VPTPRPFAVTRAGETTWIVAGSVVTGSDLSEALDNAVAAAREAAEARGGEWNPWEHGDNCRDALDAMKNGATESWAFPDPDSEEVGEARDVTPDMIAAAPDLLTALRGLLADGYLADPLNADRMAAARAAVALADGRA